MAKQLNVNLAFTADTSQAAAQVKNLQQTLTQLVNQPIGIGQKMTDDIMKASAAAADLKIHLQNATNVKTGTLDFSKLNQSLKSSGVSLNQYAMQLQQLGPKGQEAFMQLARSVANAEVPLKRANGLLASFGTTLMNTARWQLSSTMLHGFIGSISSAYNYSKDLNESLNNIRIVTGKNIDEMSRFADQANRAAKALSATTTAYTDAALIYYQQGLSDEEVLGRAETTIKLANVSRQSAEVVSDQMTAIWNNFYDGGKSLEYYADVVTALGAATASSSSEIATGLEKFASVAETVGLSYEYATAALATVTATTRQSADVVGTAFKTLFARLNDLKLGETLDDGTTLGQYTENLAKVGVNIKDASGQLKDMDTILEETAAKWKELDKDQQVALAKGVAGIRQYNQFIALMNNWDFMQKNLETISEASGTLEKQNDTYAESWEAASKRIRASLEAIYSSVMKDEFFIDLTNGFAKAADGVGAFIKGIGGLKGVISALGFVITKVFADKMAMAFETLTYNIQMSSAAGRKAAQEAKLNTMKEFASQMNDYETSTVVGLKSKQVYEEELMMQQQLIENADQLSTAEKQRYQYMIESHRAMGEQSIELAKQLELTKEKIAAGRVELSGVGLNNRKEFSDVTSTLNTAKERATAMGEIDIALKKVASSASITTNEIEELKLQLAQAGVRKKDIAIIGDEFVNAGNDSEALKAAIEHVNVLLSQSASKVTSWVAKMLGIDEASPEFENLSNKISAYMQNTRGAVVQTDNLNISMNNGKNMADKFSNSMHKLGEKTKSTSQLMTSVISGAMAFGMIISSINGLIDTLKDPDSSGWEKFGSILTSVSMIAMSVMGVFTGLKAAYDLLSSGMLKNTFINVANSLAMASSEKQMKKSVVTMTIKELIQRKNNKTTRDTAAANTAQAATQDAVNKENKEAIILEGMKNKKNGQSPTLQKGAGKALLQRAGGGLLIAASIALVVSALKEASDHYNKAQKNAEDAAQATADLAAHAEDMKNAYNDFNSTLDGYNDAKDSLKGLTKGTVEYTEALMEANSQAMDLINKYDLMDKYHIEEGLIVFDEGALEEAKKAQLASLNQAQAITSIGNATSSYFSRQSQETKLNREMDTSSDNGSNVGNTALTTGLGAVAGYGLTAGGALLAGASAGAAFGSMVPIIGTIIGGSLGLIGGIIATSVMGAESKAEDEALDKIIQYVDQNGNDIFAAQNAEKFGQMLKDANLEIDDDKLVKSLYDNKKAVEELTKVEVQKIKKEENDFANAFHFYNMSNDEYANLEAGQGYLQQQAIDYRQSEIDEITKDVEELWSGSNDDFWAEYLKYIYGQKDVDEGNTTGENVRITDLGGDYVTVQKKNDEGIWETVGEEDSLSEEVAQQMLINAKLLAQASEAMDMFDLDSLIKDMERMGLVVEEDNEIIDSILAQFGENKNIDLSKFTFGDIKQIEENLNKIKNNDLKKSLEEGIENYKENLNEIYASKEFEDWYKTLTPEQQDILWNIDIDQETSLDSLKNTLANMQDYLDSVNLSTQITVKSQMENLLTTALKSNSDEDWNAFKTAYESAKYDKSYQDFLALSNEEKLNYLNQDYFDTATSIVTEEEYVGAKNNAENLEKKGEEAQARIDELDGLIETEQGKIDAANDRITGRKSGDVSVPRIGKKGAIVPEKAASEMIANSMYSGSHIPGLDQSESYKVPYTSQIYGDIVYDGQNYLYTGVRPDIDSDYYTNDWRNGFANLLDTMDSQGISTDNKMYKYILDIVNNQGPSDNMINELMELSKEYKITANKEDIENILSGYDPESPNHVANLDKLIALLGDKYNVDLGLYDFYQGDDTIISDASANIKTYNKERTEKNTIVTETTPQEIEKRYRTASQLEYQYQTGIDNFAKYYNLDTEELKSYIALMEQEYGPIIKDSYETNKEYSQSLLNVAIANKRMEKGVKTLGGNWDKWNDIMSDSNSTIEDISTILPDVNNALLDVLNLDQTEFELLPPDFAQKNWSLVQDVINGVEGSIDELRNQAGKEILLTVEGSVDANGNLKAGLDQIHNAIASYDNANFTVGVALDPEQESQFYRSCQSIVNAAQMSEEQATAYFKNMGYNVEFDDNPQTVEEQVVHHAYEYDYDENGDPIYRKVTPIFDTYTRTIDAPTIKTITPNGSYGGGINVDTTPPKVDTDTGKSASKGNKSPRKKRSDSVERYKDIDSQISKTNHLMEQNSTLAEGMWGKERSKLMQENIKHLEAQNDLYDERIEKAKQFLEMDKQDLLNLNVGFEIDEEGLVSNHEEVMNRLFDNYNNTWYAYTGGNEEAELTEDQTKELDRLWKIFEDAKSAYGQYDKALNDLWDSEKAKAEGVLKKQTEIFNDWSTRLEENLAFEENELEYLEHQLGRIADDFYQTAEGLALMIGSFDKNGNWDSSKSQYGMYVSRGQDYEKQKEELDRLYKNGEINKQQYLDGLEDLSSKVMENENAMRELDNTMMHYYGDTLAAAGERLGRFTALQEHHTSVLDHYTSALELMGKAADPRNMTEIIKAQKDVAENSLDTSKAWYDSMKAQADARKAEYDAAVASGADADTLKWYEEQWLSAQEVANEAEEQMLSDYEAWLEAVKAETQNAIDIQNKEWEKSLIAGMFGENNKFSSFEDVNLALDRQKSLQEDILTTTNKKYETDKLIRQVQQDIDKSTNSVAKKELKAFIQRTQAKQDQTKLSETELGILQKEYELLQAKIALEEAQNAKSTVRLQRDSEGNFGYVYTADENKIADAEQNYADKENELYNARLDAANDYSEKYIQAQMEMHQTLSDLHQQYLDGEFESEEAYNNAVTAAKEYYYELLEQYQDIYHNIFADNSTWVNDFMSGESNSLHNTVTTNAELMADSIIGQSGLATEQWSKNFDAQDVRTQEWKKTTEGYISNVSTAFGTMQTTINGKATLLGNDLDGIKKKTEDIVTENKNLTDSITNPKTGLIKGLNDEIVAVQNVTGQYALMREEVNKNITAQENLLAAINASASAIYEQDAPSNDDTSGSDNSDSSNNSDSGNSGSSSSTKWFGSATWERGVEVYDYINRGLLGNGISNRIAAGATYGFNQDEVLLGQSIIDNVYPISKNGAGMSWEDAKKRLGFDTGGYTGEWDGGYGKLAFLHSKELVLNQGDTANFLASMELLDSIIKTIDLYSANAQWSGLLSTPTFGNYGSEPLEQNVHIEASFPGVTDKNQIEEAFNDIINLASQYANRKY